MSPEAAGRLIQLPEEFPVFPLPGTLLLPFGRLPLNIFEPRYLAMVEDSLGSGRMFGMVQPDKRLAEGDTGPGLFRTGCLGRIVSFTETEDGRFLITLAGMIRYTIVEEIESQRGYRRVRAALGAFTNDVAEVDETLPYPRARLMEVLRRYFAHHGVDANWETIEALPESELVTSLCMACPFEPEEKQALLEAKDAQERARVLLAMLEINAFGDGRDDKPKAS